MKKVVVGLTVLGVASLLNAEVKTFGCGITKSAYLMKLNAAYAQEANEKVVVTGRGGAPKAIKLMGKDKVDIATGCRPPLKSIAGEENVKETHIAWGAIVPIANKSNPINNITSAQFKDILTGKIKNWKEIGGNDEAISLYARKGKTSGVGYSTRQILFSDASVDYASNASLKGSSGPIRKAVSKLTSAFGVDDFASAKNNTKLKMLSVDGIKPTKENISNGSYPLPRPLFIYSNESPNGKTKQYFEFATSAKGQQIISDNGVVNLAEGKNLKRLY